MVSCFWGSAELGVYVFFPNSSFFPRNVDLLRTLGMQFLQQQHQHLESLMQNGAQVRDPDGIPGAQFLCSCYLLEFPRGYGEETG